MNTAECHSRAKLCLKGCYGEAFIVTAICLFVYTVFRAGVLLLGYALGDDAVFAVVEGVLTLLCFAVMTPLLTGGIWWFYQTASGGDNRNLLKLYSGLRLNRRAAILYILMWGKSFLSLFPTALCWAAAYIIFYGESELSAELTLFASFQLIVLGVVLIFVFVSSLLSTVLAPFIFIKRPDTNLLSVIAQSARLMKGRKLEFLKLILKYLPPMLPIVTIPFVMPSAVMTAAVFAKESIESGQVVYGKQAELQSGEKYRAEGFSS